MPVQLQGATPITLHACKLIANGVMPYAAPGDFGFIGAANLSAPLSINAQGLPSFLPPNVLAIISESNPVAPVNKPAITQANAAAPRVLPPKASSDLPPFPLTHPRILYQNLLNDGSVDVSGGNVNPGVLTPSTYDRWNVTVTTTQSILVLIPENRNIDSIAIAGLADTGQTVEAFYSLTTSGAFVSAGGFSCSGGGARMWLLPAAVSARRVQINITGAGQQTIAVISAGIALQMQRAMYGGVNPITLNRVTDHFNNRSESGEWLGRQIRRRGLEASLSFDRLTAPWYRQYFDPFAQSARTTPFFFAWRPSDYPNEVAYCWTDGDMSPSNSGGATNHMSVSFSVKAHS